MAIPRFSLRSLLVFTFAASAYVAVRAAVPWENFQEGGYFIWFPWISATLTTAFAEVLAPRRERSSFEAARRGGLTSLITFLVIAAEVLTRMNSSGDFSVSDPVEFMMGGIVISALQFGIGAVFGLPGALTVWAGKFMFLGPHEPRDESRPIPPDPCPPDGPGTGKP